MKKVRRSSMNRMRGDKPLVYVKYLDHALYRNLAPLSSKPVIRETVGWLLYENDETVWILWDKNAAPTIHEKFDPSSSLVIVKRCILEMRRIS